MSYGIPARGIHAEPVARLKPAVGEELRQASPKLRAGEERPSRSDFHSHNPVNVDDSRQMVDLRPDVSFRRPASGVSKVIVTR